MIRQPPAHKEERYKILVTGVYLDSEKNTRLLEPLLGMKVNRMPNQLQDPSTVTWMEDSNWFKTEPQRATQELCRSVNNIAKETRKRKRQQTIPYLD